MNWGKGYPGSSATPAQDIMGQLHDPATILAWSITHYGSLAKTHVSFSQSQFEFLCSKVQNQGGTINLYWCWFIWLEISKSRLSCIKIRGMRNRFKLWAFDTSVQHGSSLLRLLWRYWVNCHKTDLTVPFSPLKKNHQWKELMELKIDQD